MSQDGSIAVVVDDRHVGHCPTIELQQGQPVPALDHVSRIDRIVEVLRRHPQYEIVAPHREAGDILPRVHDADMLAYLDHAWDRHNHRRPPGWDAIVADTFLSPALTTTTPPSGSPAEIGTYCFDTYSSIQERTVIAARSAADVATSTAARVADGAPLALGLARPPGHHATRRGFGGGCFINNDAVAAETLRLAGMERVAVLDVDAHHGNGSQAIYYDCAEVAYLSVHGDPATTYPYFTGRREETGVGDGLGHTHNRPLPTPVTGHDVQLALDELLEAIVAHRSEAIVLTLGVDFGAGDPAAVGTLTEEDFARIGQAIGRLDLPVVALFAGGYDLDAIGALTHACLGGLAESMSAR